MLIIQDKLIAQDLIDEQFMCALDACHGACCWEGDFGAPLTPVEIDQLTDDLEKIRPFLSIEGQHAIADGGIWALYDKQKFKGTTLLENGACAFMTKDDQGIAQCGIEQAHQEGQSKLLKPISCHLYPVRVTEEPDLNFEALNYDRWNICSAACKKGAIEKMPVYRFVQTALIRKYGQDFYEELDAAAEHLKQVDKPRE